MTQVARSTRSGSMPATRASCGFSEVARIARPSVLRCRNRCSAITVTAVSPSTNSWSGVMRMPPQTLRGSSGMAICSSCE